MFFKIHTEIATNTHSKLQTAMREYDAGRWNIAAAICEEILSVATQHPGASHLLGVIKQQTGDYQGALQLFEQALATVTDNPSIYFNQGNALQELEQFHAAVASYDNAIACQPNFADAYCNRGNALQKIGHLADAITSYEKAIELQSDFSFAHFNRGNALQKLARYDEALISYNHAITSQPDFIEAYANRGIVLEKLQLIDQALANYDQALAIDPNCAEIYVNKGILFKNLSRFEESIACNDKGIEVNPDFALSYFNKSLILLLLGDFERGLPLYEWRGKGKLVPSLPESFAKQRWCGDASLVGKTLLLHCEQGLGDTLQFCRYAQVVAKLGARVILAVPATLSKLLTGLAGVDQVVTKEETLPAFDYYSSLLSLPLACQTRLATIPAPYAYLQADQQKKTVWQARLFEPKNQPRLRIGLAWSGNEKHNNDQYRSLPLATLLPYLPADCDYICLQKDCRASDRLVLDASRQICFIGTELQDFADTAAVCDLMDIVISVDTSIAHLAGALGRETWILLPSIPDWRWLLERDDSPWYPSAKLYRQEIFDDWKGVLEKMSADLLLRIAKAV